LGKTGIDDQTQKRRGGVKKHLNGQSEKKSENPYKKKKRYPGQSWEG